MGQVRNLCRVLIEKGKISLGKTRLRWEDNIKIEPK
jgi:hypothetical protein